MLEQGGMQGGGRCHNSVKTGIFKNSVSSLEIPSIQYGMESVCIGEAEEDIAEMDMSGHVIGVPRAGQDVPVSFYCWT
jgi:hypothetical protein